MWRYLRWVLLAVGVLIAIIVVLPFVLPADVYKDQIIAQAKQATGRDLKIDGALRISFFPELGVEVNQVHFGNAAGAATPDMATMERLVVGAELFPLLSGQVKITHITLVKPVINLEIDKNGRGNWLFDVPAAQAPATAPEAPARHGSGLGDLSFQDVRLSGGTLTYRDARSKVAQQVENIDASVQLPSLDQPMIFSGGLTWNKENIKIDATVAEPRALSQGGKSALNAKIAGDVMNASFDGSLNAGIGAIGGKIDFKTTSARRLAAWFGVPLPQVRGFGPMTLTGDMTSSAGRVSFANAKLSLDNMNGSGDLALDTAGAKPRVDGNFTLNRLDLNQYTGGGTRGQSNSGSGGFPAWSDSPIDFGPLALVDADFDFAVDALEVGELKIGRSALSVMIQGGNLGTHLKELELYGGHGSGHLSLEGGKGTPSLTLDLTISGVQGEPFLTDAIGFTKLEGTGGFVVRVSATGSSQRAWMHSLDGTANISFLNGAIKGINLAEMARAIQSALTGSAIGGAAKTDFAELSGSFVIRNGVAANKDLKLLNPFVRLNGAGVIDIGSQTLDYRVEPKAVGSIKGQGGNGDLAGIGIPFRIHGSWSNPKYEPDLSGVVNSAIDAVLQGKKPAGLGGLIPGVGGDTSQPADDQGQQPKKGKKKSPLDKLNDILGGGK